MYKRCVTFVTLSGISVNNHVRMPLPRLRNTEDSQACTLIKNTQAVAE